MLAIIPQTINNPTVGWPLIAAKSIDYGATMRLSPAWLLLYVLPLAFCAEDYYKLLDIDKSASEKDIKRAYRTLSKKYHPDKNP